MAESDDAAGVPDRPVADIARSLGFPSAECFEKFFRLVAGSSASDFRRFRC